MRRIYDDRLVVDDRRLCALCAGVLVRQGAGIRCRRGDCPAVHLGHRHRRHGRSNNLRAAFMGTVNSTTRCRSQFARIDRVRRCGLLVALVVVLLPIATTRTRTRPAAAYPDPPQVLYQDLFVAVQSTAIFADGKAFPDAVPNLPPHDILAQYHASRPDSPPALKRFIEMHFALPAQVTAAPSPHSQVSIVTHIDELWDPLT